MIQVLDEAIRELYGEVQTVSEDALPGRMSKFHPPARHRKCVVDAASSLIGVVDDLASA